jgi:hypothetical protein
MLYPFEQKKKFSFGNALSFRTKLKILQLWKRCTLPNKRKINAALDEQILVIFDTGSLLLKLMELYVGAGLAQAV